MRLKPHNYPDSYWYELFNPNLDGFPIQTNSNFTVIPIAAEGATETEFQIPTGATTDIQVEAMIGHIGRNNTMTPYPYPYVFFGETSGWSNTQTVTLPPKTPITPSPSPTSTIPEFPDRTGEIEPFPTLLVVAITVTVAAVIGVGLLTYFKKRKR